MKNITWQLDPLLSSDSIILALRSVRRARFEAVLVVVAVGLLHVDATVPEHDVSVSPRKKGTVRNLDLFETCNI